MRTRFLVAFIVVATVPLVVFGALVYSRTAAALREVERDEIVAQTTSVREVLRRRVTDERAFIHDYSVWDDLHAATRRSDRAWIRDNVTEWVPANSTTSMVTVFGRDGRVVARGGDQAAYSLWAEEQVQAARRGVAGADLERIGGRLYVVAAAPIVAQTQPSRAEGVLVFGQVIGDEVLRSINRVSGGRGRLSLYTGLGVSAATAPAGRHTLEAFGPADHAVGQVFSEGTFTSRLVAIEDRRGATVSLLKVSVPRDAFTTALGQIHALAIAAFVLALLIAGGMGLLFSETISRPLRQLSAAAADMARGDLRQELPTQRRDEIGLLAQAFNEMSERVADRVEALSGKTRTLALGISNLSAFGVTLAQTPDPFTELRRLTDMIRAMFDADAASIFLVYDGHTTRAAFSGGHRSPVPSPAADELAAWVVEHACSLEVPDAGTDGRLSAPARGTNQLSSFLVVPLTRPEGVVGALSIAFRRRHDFGPEDLPLLTTIGGQIAIALQNSEAYEKLDRMYLETVTALAAAMEAKDQYTASHADSLAAMAVAVGARMGLSDGELRMLQYAAVLHDIGKIGIPGSILNKPDKLTRDEFDAMAQHTIIGERIISRIDHLVPIARIIRSAHERWDGEGYPDGRRHAEIPLAARILLVCDAFDAMTTDRPYRKALPLEAALSELNRNAGSQFDPRVVDVFLASYPFAKRETERLGGRLTYAGVVELN